VKMGCVYQLLQFGYKDESTANFSL
jgi:hypothetical protein